MNFFSGILNGFKEIWAHKFRSFLSMIGIILGVAALVAMIGFVKGMTTQFRSYFESTGGALKVEISENEPPLEQQDKAFLSPGLTIKDWEAVQHNVPLARLSAPLVDAGWHMGQSKYRRDWLRFSGTTPDMEGIIKLDVAQGRFISDLDVENHAQVLVLSKQNAERLFPNLINPVGERVFIGGQAFTVIGVLKGTEDWRWWKSYLAYIPATTALKRFTEDDQLRNLQVQAYDFAEIPDLVAQLENVLLYTHRGIQDFKIETEEERIAEFEKTEAGFMYSLGGVAAITLLVGGIGIMNVMLAVINERIREIGVRKAVGARGIDIFGQFIAESVVISVLGGLIGIIASVGLVELVRELLPPDRQHIVLAPEAMLLGFGFSVAIGVLSGIYPALRAARLNVIEALRYE